LGKLFLEALKKCGISKPSEDLENFLFFKNTFSKVYIKNKKKINNKKTIKKHNS